jgi:trk system potassium uptake protein TrkH
MKTVWAFFIAYIVVLGVVALAISLTEVDASHSLVASAAALTNVGPLYDMVTNNVEHGQSVRELHGGALWAISAAMILGRVELIAVLSVLSLNFWRR